ncbi:MAG TPA: YihY/virulence factor BrkB family protein [Nevskiales bacterium]|nr:YihY/virulence factor BrkB family protein [Nevskiales bacterium]
MLDRLNQRLDDWIWERDLESLPPQAQRAFLALRLTHAALRDLTDSQFSMRAMGLVYTTLLSFVPFLAISFSLLKALGVHNRIEPILVNFLAPLGEAAPQISRTIIGFVENIKVGVLGAVGVVLLLYAVISLIQKVESGCNYIWKVDRPRSFARRFSEYLSVLTVGPVILFSALALTASVMNQTLVQKLVALEPFGFGFYVLSQLFPYLLVCGGFTALYLFIPNTRVRPAAALVGGVVAGIAWQTASWVFAAITKTATQYDAIYSSFAILIFLLIWLYVSWMVLLVGCHIAFLWQHPEHLTRRQTTPRMGGRLQEEIALQVMALVGHNLIQRLSPWHEETLARHLGVPPEHLYRVLDILLARGFLVHTADERPALLPGCDLDNTSVAELLAAVRASDPGLRVRERELAPQRLVAQVMQRLDQAAQTATGNLSLRQLAEGIPPRQAELLRGAERAAS